MRVRDLRCLPPIRANDLPAKQKPLRNRWTCEEINANLCRPRTCTRVQPLVAGCIFVNKARDAYQTTSNPRDTPRSQTPHDSWGAKATATQGSSDALEKHERRRRKATPPRRQQAPTPGPPGPPHQPGYQVHYLGPKTSSRRSTCQRPPGSQTPWRAEGATKQRRNQARPRPHPTPLTCPEHLTKPTKKQGHAGFCCMLKQAPNGSPKGTPKWY